MSNWIRHHFGHSKEVKGVRGACRESRQGYLGRRKGGVAEGRRM